MRDSLCVFNWNNSLHIPFRFTMEQKGSFMQFELRINLYTTSKRLLLQLYQSNQTL